MARLPLPERTRRAMRIAGLTEGDRPLTVRELLCTPGVDRNEIRSRLRCVVAGDSTTGWIARREQRQFMELSVCKHLLCERVVARFRIVRRASSLLPSPLHLIVKSRELGPANHPRERE